MNVNNANKINFSIGNSENKLNIKDEKNVSFKEFLKNSVYEVSDMEKKADDLNLKFLTGEVDNLHDVMIATQKADVGIQSFIEVKNKIIDAYKEILRIQI